MLPKLEISFKWYNFEPYEDFLSSDNSRQDFREIISNSASKLDRDVGMRE